jgi:hypothetical protein
MSEEEKRLREQRFLQRYRFIEKKKKVGEEK